jgi:hypothetical protein
MPSSSIFCTERGFGEARGRLGRVAERLARFDARLVALHERRQHDVLLLELGFGLVVAFDVGAQIAREKHGLAARHEICLAAVVESAA